MNKEILNLIRKQMNDAMCDYRAQLRWYIYTFLPLFNKYRLPLGCDLDSRRWWFLLKEVKHNENL